MPRAYARLDPAIIQHEVDNLRAAYPELAEDDYVLALGSETDLLDFLAAMVKRERRDKAHIAGIDAEIDVTIDELSARKRRFERRIEGQRKFVFRLMEHAGLRKLELDTATVSIRKGPAKVIVTDENALPENCFRIKRTPNLTFIKELIDQGVPVEGATLSNAEDILNVSAR
jgi:hypothetical protein